MPGIAISNSFYSANVSSHRRTSIIFSGSATNRRSAILSQHEKYRKASDCVSKLCEVLSELPQNSYDVYISKLDEFTSNVKNKVFFSLDPVQDLQPVASTSAATLPSLTGNFLQNFIINCLNEKSYIFQRFEL